MTVIASESISWLADQGCRFALPFGRTKNKFETDWPNKSHTLAEALKHAKNGGNVGILTGKHSGGIVALDRDVEFEQTCVMLGDLSKTAKIIRTNAPGRGKLLYRINGAIPQTTSWKPKGATSPEAEFLGDNGQRHALCPPSIIDGGTYELIDTEYGIQTITPVELDYIWRLITGGSIYKEQRTQEEAQINEADTSDYVRNVKEAWTVKTVFEHFNKAKNGTEKDRGETRILGNGGLLISADGSQWYDHADSIGGDKLDAWAWCKWGKRIDRNNPKMFWDVVNDMAGVKGISKPETKRTYTNGTNGNGSHNHAEQGAGDGYAKAEEKASTVDALHYRAEDGGILDAWMDLYGEDWIFSVGHDLWYQWSGTHWALDNALRLGECIQDLMDRMNQECSRTIKEAPEKIKSIADRFANAGIDIPDKALKEIENIKTSIDVAKALHKATKRSSHRVNSVDVMAQKKRKAPTPSFNATESLNLANGTLDLRSLELLPHDRQDLFTYCLDYAYDSAATCQRWEQFLREVLVKEGTTETDQDLVSLLQELIGYSLTTQTKYQVMVWMSGEGSNGKSVAIAIIKALLGPMAVSVDFQTLGTPGNYDMADIPGARVLFSLESEKGVGISEKHIKSIVTGDPMKTRPIYGSPIDFVSTAKIWWAMNDKPVIKDTTNAIWRRMKLIPFYRTFEEGVNADPDLLEKLRAELPGILNWAIKGLTRLTVNKKFTGSETSNTAKQQYREQSNPVAQWINTMTVRTDFPATLQAALYANFKSWCIDNGERVVTSTQFGLDLKRLKIDSKHRNTGNMYHLALVDSKEK